MIILLSWHPDAIPGTAPRLAYQTGPSLIALRLSLLPACPLRDQVCFHPSCSPRQHGPSALCRSHLPGGAPPFKQPMLLYPRGPRSGPGYAILAHHHLAGPSAPLAGTSRFHRTAAYTRCLRCAGAPRRPASGSALSLTDLSQHVVLYVPGEPSLLISSFFATRACLRRKPCGSALPMLTMSGLTDSPLLQPAELLASLQETFTSELSTDWSPSPLSDITTVATGRFHRRDLHPQDQQLASLHRFHFLISDPPLPRFSQRDS